MATSTTAMSATGTMTGMAAATSTKAAMSGMGSSGCKISVSRCPHPTASPTLSNWNWNANQLTYSTDAVELEYDISDLF